MNVYRLDTDLDVWGGLYTRHGDWDRFKPFDGSPMLAGWDPVEVLWDEDAKRPRGTSPR